MRDLTPPNLPSPRGRGEENKRIIYFWIRTFFPQSLPLSSWERGPGGEVI
jgi:hypothetical protein